MLLLFLNKILTLNFQESKTYLYYKNHNEVSMPIYEYKCKQCKNKFEFKQSMNEPDIQICPECGGNLSKLISAAGIVFKGSGFYVNDSKKSCPNASMSDSSPCQTCSNAPK